MVLNKFENSDLSICDYEGLLANTSSSEISES
jgi:hypothetical protein